MSVRVLRRDTSNEDGTNWGEAIGAAMDRIDREAAEAATREPLEVEFEWSDGTKTTIPGMGPVKEEL